MRQQWREAILVFDLVYKGSLQGSQVKISGKLYSVLMLTFEKLLLQAIVLTGIEAFVTRNWICNRFERQNFHCFMTYCIQLLILYLIDRQSTIKK